MRYEDILPGMRAGKLVILTIAAEDTFRTLTVRIDEKGVVQKNTGSEGAFVNFTDLDLYMNNETWGFKPITTIASVTLSYGTLVSSWDSVLFDAVPEVGSAAKSSLFRAFANAIGFTNG